MLSSTSEVRKKIKTTATHLTREAEIKRNEEARKEAQFQKMKTDLQAYQARRQAELEAVEEKKKIEKLELEKKQKEEMMVYQKGIATEFNYRLISELKAISETEYLRIVRSAQTPDSRNVVDMFDLARCCHHGIHITFTNHDKKNERIIHWLTVAAKLGYAPAKFDLAIFYLTGEAVAPDPSNHKRAVALLMEAAREGYTPAFKILGQCYLHNMGVEPSSSNLFHAYGWFETPAEAGDLKAKEGLSLCEKYLRMFGDDPKDRNKAQAAGAVAGGDGSAGAGGGGGGGSGAGDNKNSAEHLYQIGLKNEVKALSSPAAFKEALYYFMQAALKRHAKAEAKVAEYITLQKGLPHDLRNKYLRSLGVVEEKKHNGERAALKGSAAAAGAGAAVAAGAERAAAAAVPMATAVKAVPRVATAAAAASRAATAAASPATAEPRAAPTSVPRAAMAATAAAASASAAATPQAHSGSRPKLLTGQYDDAKEQSERDNSWLAIWHSKKRTRSTAFRDNTKKDTTPQTATLKQTAVPMEESDPVARPAVAAAAAAAAAPAAQQPTDWMEENASSPPSLG